MRIRVGCSLICLVVPWNGDWVALLQVGLGELELQVLFLTPLSSSQMPASNLGSELPFLLAQSALWLSLCSVETLCCNRYYGSYTVRISASLWTLTACLLEPESCWCGNWLLCFSLPLSLASVFRLAISFLVFLFAIVAIFCYQGWTKWEVIWHLWGQEVKAP